MLRRRYRINILIACEYSGIVRDAFIAKGHKAISCDLLKTESVGPHYEGDVIDILDLDWDLIIAHPPCTFLAVSGARWMYHPKYPNRKIDQDKALEFIKILMAAKAPKICIENPVGAISTKIRKPDQYIQPWQFGHGETKKTGLWLKGLPKLVPTKIVSGREQRVHKVLCNLPYHLRGKERSRTYIGVATAMADQWG